MRFVLNTPNDTEYFGALLAYIYLMVGKVPCGIFLTGDLGAGKSAIARGFVRHLTGRKVIASPSYLLSLEYSFQINGEEHKIYHVDPWRLKSTQKMSQMLPLDEVRGSILLLEHPAKATDLVSALEMVNTVHIVITGNEHGVVGMGRIVTIESSFFDLAMLRTMFDSHKELKQYAPTPDDVSTPAYVPIAVPPNKTVRILGIETSCDDTGIAVVDSHGKILIQHLIGQEEAHKQYGGVFPNEAQRLHRDALDKYVESAILETHAICGEYPDAIAFTIGPGLSICLIEGCLKVYEMSKKYNIPIIPTHHLESHIMVCYMPQLGLDVECPFISCVVSGGHTFIAYVEAMGKYHLLSTTVDDSIGEIFDKVGRELGIETVPAGKHLETMAVNGKICHELTKPVIKDALWNMSFSGIKSQTVNLVRKVIAESGSLPDVAASFQDHVASYFVDKVRYAMGTYKLPVPPTSIVVAGGVACNMVLRKKLNALGKELGLVIKYPPVALCTDNGVMVAWNGYEKFKSGFVLPPTLDHQPDDKVEVRPTWKLWSDHQFEMVGKKEKEKKMKVKAKVHKK